MADAQVVVVVVGSMDCRVPKGHPGRTLAYTLEHVKALVDERFGEKYGDLYAKIAAVA